MAGLNLPRRFMFAAFLALSSPLSATAAEPSAVVVSIKPLHSLVAGVMAGAGQPILLLDGTQSPHTYALKPSDAAVLERAPKVFWMGPSLEGFLVAPLKTLDPVVSVELGQRLGDLILPSRPESATGHDEHGNHDGHDDSHDTASKDESESDHHDEHGHSHVDEHGEALPDLHAWLDPQVASQMVGLIADELAKADPDGAALYRENAAALAVRLKTLDEELSAMLKPVHERPFIVFHDAYQYFGRRYDLHWAGSLSVSPEHPPGARHLSELREQIEAGKAACVFAEPQFEPRMVERLVEGTGAKAATLDPDGGIDLEPGPEAYFQLMRTLAKTFVDCLKG